VTRNWKDTCRYVELAAASVLHLENRIVQVVMKLTTKPNFPVQCIVVLLRDK